jgi:RloB-like protein
VPDKSDRTTGRSGRRRNGFARETDLRRLSNARQERRTVLIVTNGSRTEVDYFEALKREPWVTAAKVTVKFQPGAPDAVVNRAAKIRDNSGYSEAWGVCDVDEFDVTAAIVTASDHQVDLALSAPSFEVWLILHHSEGCPSFNSATQVSAHLKKLVGNWDKTKLNYQDFRTGVFNAVTRAQRLGDPPGANPATEVWRLVESLRSDKIPA